jgi:branched-chain amino acid transport system substrate-binding protein
LWGGDLTSFIDQAGIYGLMRDRQFFGVNMADYAVLTAVKAVPPGLHSGNRYLKSVPNTPQNAAWSDEYFARWNELPLNWAWQNAVGAEFVLQAMKQANSVESDKVADVLRGMTIESPLGDNGTITMRAEDQTIIDYAIAWGDLRNSEPYMPRAQLGNWAQITELESEWKAKRGW